MNLNPKIPGFYGGNFLFVSRYDHKLKATIPVYYNQSRY